MTLAFKNTIPFHLPLTCMTLSTMRVNYVDGRTEIRKMLMPKCLSFLKFYIALTKRANVGHRLFASAFTSIFSSDSKCNSSVHPSMVTTDNRSLWSRAQFVVSVTIHSLERVVQVTFCKLCVCVFLVTVLEYYFSVLQLFHR